MNNAVSKVEDALIALDKEEGDDVLDIGIVKGLLAEYESAYELFSKDLTTSSNL